MDLRQAGLEEWLLASARLAAASAEPGASTSTTATTPLILPAVRAPSRISPEAARRERDGHSHRLRVPAAGALLPSGRRPQAGAARRVRGQRRQAVRRERPRPHGCPSPSRPPGTARAGRRARGQGDRRAASRGGRHRHQERQRRRARRHPQARHHLRNQRQARRARQEFSGAVRRFRVDVHEESQRLLAARVAAAGQRLARGEQADQGGSGPAVRRRCHQPARRGIQPRQPSRACATTCASSAREGKLNDLAKTDDRTDLDAKMHGRLGDLAAIKHASTASSRPRAPKGCSRITA